MESNIVVEAEISTITLDNSEDCLRSPVINKTATNNNKIPLNQELSIPQSRSCQLVGHDPLGLRMNDPFIGTTLHY